MKTNEEIVNKIREMRTKESEKIEDLCSALTQQRERKEIEKADKTQKELSRQLAVWVALVDLEAFADED